MQGETNETKDLFNRWNSEGNTVRTYLMKTPLLNDGAFTGGTTSIVTGTSGTKHGTHLFYPEYGKVYVLKGLGFNINQNGTFGTSNLTGVIIDGVNLGTLGTIADFATKYGDAISLFGTLKIGVRIDTGTGIIGTYKVDSEVLGWKFKALS